MHVLRDTPCEKTGFLTITKGYPVPLSETLPFQMVRICCILQSTQVLYSIALGYKPHGTQIPDLYSPQQASIHFVALRSLVHKFIYLVCIFFAALFFSRENVKLDSHLSLPYHLSLSCIFLGQTPVLPYFHLAYENW